MGDSEETASQKDEQDFSIPGQGDDDNASAGADLSGGAPSGPAQPSAPTGVAPNAAMTPSTPPGQPPKVSGRAMFLGNLLKTILSGVQNAPGNPRNPVDRGFMAASPQNQQRQQADLSKIASEADIAKTNSSIAQLHLLQTKHMVDRLDQDDQDKFIQASNDYYKFLVDKEGMEVETTGTLNGAISEAGRLNVTDPKAKGGLGAYVPLAHRDSDGKVTSSVLFFPHNDVLKNDLKLANPSYDPDGPDDESNPKEITLPAGTPQKALPQVANRLLAAGQNLTKDQHKELQKVNNLPEDGPEKIRAKASQLQGLLDAHDNAFINHNKANIQATIDRLNKDLPAAEEQRLKEAKAMATQVTIPTKEAEKADESVYAFDPKSKQYTLTTRGNAPQGAQVFKATPEFDKSLKNSARLEDVTNKILDYRDTFATGLSTSDKHVIENFESEHPAMITGPGIGDFKLQVGAQGAGLDEAARDLDQRVMSPQAKARLRTYITAKTTALEMQRIETDSARMSQGGMQLDLGALARPSDDPDTALKKLEAFQRSVQTFSKASPRAPGTKGVEDINAERPFKPKAATEKPPKKGDGKWALTKWLEGEE